MKRIVARPAGRARPRGFTLPEVLAAVLLTTIVMTAATKFFAFQLGSMRTERTRRAAQMTARTALNFVVRQLEHAGRDPQAVLFSNAGNATLPPAIVAAGGASIHYRANLSTSTTDNDTLDDWEDVTFDTNGGVLRVTEGTGAPIPLTDGSTRASHVADGGLVLRYFNGAGQQVTNLSTATARASVRRINVSLTVVGGPPEGVTARTPRVTLSQDVFLRNVS
jgi:prepilin-type N-terminal cleavage/methylation domain-containing protein